MLAPFRLANRLRKQVTARQLRWILGRPLFASFPALRRRYSVATSSVDIRDVGELIHDEYTETDIMLAPAVLAYCKRFEAQLKCPIEGSNLRLGHQFRVFRLGRCAQLAHTGTLIDLRTERAIDPSNVPIGRDGAVHRNRFRPFRFRKVVQVPGPALSLLAPWKSHRHFAHFILERFRQLLAALSAVPALQSATLVVQDKLPAFQRAALAQLALEFPNIRFLEVAPDVRLEFDALHIPVEPRAHNFTWFAKRELLEAVRDLYLDAYGLSAVGTGLHDGKRLFLSRNRQKLRRLLNEDEVLTRLAPHAVQFVQPELLPHKDQIRLMQEASVIIAPSGSAITNLLFCKPGARLILTGPIDEHEPFWAGLALAMGLDFAFVPGSVAGWRRGFRVDATTLELALVERTTVA